MIVSKLDEINNLKLNYTYSDSNKYIIQNETGIMYQSAWDIVPCPYTYSESDIEIPLIDETLTKNEISNII